MHPRSGSMIAVRQLIAALACCCVSAATSQTAFTDGAGRSVVLPVTVERVFAAGAPAEVLLYTLVPGKLVGRNQIPSPAARELMPPEYRTPRQIVNLPDRDEPRYDAELLALDVDVYVDYGTVDDDYVAALEAISGRTGVPGVILDGRLTQIPTVYRELGAALGVAERGSRLAAEAERLFAKYRGRLAGTPLRVYLACSQDGLSPCFRGHRAGEALELLGAINVAGNLEDAARRPLTLAQVRALAPDVIVAASRDAAATIRDSAPWRDIPAVAAGRVHAPPTVPFNWGPRPPSVNRLAGVPWLAYVLPGRAFDDEFFADLTSLFKEFYHVSPTPEQLRSLVQQGN